MNLASLPVPDDSSLSVSALNRQVRESLESTFPLRWIRGEISNLTHAASGHVYFSLKDSNAQVRCVMWRNKAQLLGWRLENGQQIDARALVSFYEPRGEFQLNVEAVRRSGQGNLYEQFVRLKQQLEKEGLFAVDRKRPLPAFPTRIGIVTSPKAAALHDILSALARRAPHLKITLFPSPVQGESAAPLLVRALQDADEQGSDLIILARGGGSMEDLWAFNDEGLARAIASCRSPVISGIGHETDFTIADFAADLRAPTPTAAAELAAPGRAELLRRLQLAQDQLQRRQARRFADLSQCLDRLASQLSHPREQLGRQQLTLDNLFRRLALALSKQLTTCEHRIAQSGLRLRQRRPTFSTPAGRLDVAENRLHHALAQVLGKRAMKLNTLEAGLKQLDPDAVLARGYAIVRTPAGHALKDACAVDTGDRLKITLARGQLDARVVQVVRAQEGD